MLPSVVSLTPQMQGPRAHRKSLVKPTELRQQQRQQPDLQEYASDGRRAQIPSDEYSRSPAAASSLPLQDTTLYGRVSGQVAGHRTSQHRETSLQNDVENAETQNHRRRRTSPRRRLAASKVSPLAIDFTEADTRPHHYRSFPRLLPHRQLSSTARDTCVEMGRCASLKTQWEAYDSCTYLNDPCLSFYCFIRYCDVRYCLSFASAIASRPLQSPTRKRRSRCLFQHNDCLRDIHIAKTEGQPDSPLVRSEYHMYLHPRQPFVRYEHRRRHPNSRIPTQGHVDRLPGVASLLRRHSAMQARGLVSSRVRMLPSPRIQSGCR
ncbi:hypothetical protein PC123_g14260 [Phytophthora cactorum]|nr:hypothetical protein PC123_g14260 [Phytophthora cactorum]